MSAYNFENIGFDEDQEYDKFDAEVPSKSWRHVYQSGHVHYYDDRLSFFTGTNYPTLAIRTRMRQFDDDDEPWTESWYSCSKCGERIRPGTKIETRYIASFQTCSINSQRVTPEEFDRVLGEFRDYLRAK